MRKNYVRGTDETDGTTEVISGDHLIVVYYNNGSGYKVLTDKNTYSWLRPDIYPGIRPITPADPGWFPLIDPNIMVINKPLFSDVITPPGIPGLNGQPYNDSQFPKIDMPQIPAKDFLGNRFNFKNGGSLKITPGGWKLDPTKPLDPKNALPHEWRFDYQRQF